MQRQNNQSLKHDVNSLKQKIVTLSTTPNDVADDELKAKMEDIYQMSLSWVRTNFRKATPGMLADPLLQE